MLAGDLFTNGIDLPVGNYPTDVRVAELNGDGRQDLVVMFRASLAVIYLKDDATIDLLDRYPVPPGANELTIGDFDADGDFDLAVSNYRGIRVLRNSGNGTFSDTADSFTDTSPTWTAAGDLDCDGDLDLVFGDQGTFHEEYLDGSVSVLINKGAAASQWLGFHQPVRYDIGATPASAGIGDLDGDGDLDLVTANGNELFDSATNDVSILLNQGDGTFADRVRYPVGVGPASVAVVDLNGDEVPDLVVAGSQAPAGPSGISILFGNGDGTYYAAGQYETAATSRITTSLVVSDFNGDGEPDVAVTNAGSQDIGTVTVLLGSGGGVFEESVSFVVGASPSAVTVGDLDNDGDLDLLTANYDSHDVSVLLNTTHSPPIAGDANRDGVFNQADIVHVLQAGKFLADQPATWEEGDWNGDGRFAHGDIVSALQTGMYLRDLTPDVER